MKKTAALLLSLLMIFALAACSNNSTESQGGEETQTSEGDDASAGLLTPGTLNIGMEIGYPPMEYYADDGTTPIGFDVELADALASKLGLKANFINTAWDGIFTGLDQDKYDIIISSVTVTADRKTVMEFSTPYIDNWQAIVIKPDHAPIANMEALSGLKVGYQAETTSDDIINELINTGQISDVQTNPYQQVTQCFDDLDNGRLDCVLVDSVVAAGYLKESPDGYTITWSQKADAGSEPEQLAIALKKGNQVLVDRVNAALAELESDGTLPALRADYALEIE